MDCTCLKPTWLVSCGNSSFELWQIWAKAWPNWPQPSRFFRYSENLLSPLLQERAEVTIWWYWFVTGYHRWRSSRWSARKTVYLCPSSCTKWRLRCWSRILRFFESRTRCRIHQQKRVALSKKYFSKIVKTIFFCYHVVIQGSVVTQLNVKVLEFLQSLNGKLGHMFWRNQDFLVHSSTCPQQFVQNERMLCQVFQHRPSKPWNKSVAKIMG